MSSYVPGTVVPSDHFGPEMHHKIIVINLKRHYMLRFVLLQFLSQLLLLPVLPQLDLPQILMLQLLLVRIIDLLLDLLHSYLPTLLFLTLVVVLDHHHSLPLVVPSRIRVLVYYRIFGSDEERFRQHAVYHHDETFNCEETRVVLLL